MDKGGGSGHGKSAFRCRSGRITVRAPQRRASASASSPPDGGAISGEGELEQGEARIAPGCRNLPIASREQIGNNLPACVRSESPVMLVLDPSMLIAVAALISSLSAFVWAVRRKP